MATVGRGQGLSSKTQGVGDTSKEIEDAPDQGQQGQVRGRSQSHLQHMGSSQQQRPQSQSAPKQGYGKSTSTGGPNLAPAIQRGCYCPRHPTDFRGEGWKKDAHHTYGWHISITINTTTQEADSLIAPVLRHMEQNRPRWYFVNEDDPLQYSILLNDFYEEVHGYCLHNLDYYTEWIKPRGWCHKVVLQREQLNYCKHLQGVELPPDDVERPSELTFHSHWAAYEAAKQSRVSKEVKKTKATLLEFLVLHRLEEEDNYIMGGEKGEPPSISDTVPMEIGVKAETAVSRGDGHAPSANKHIYWEEQVQLRDDEEQAAKEAPKRKLPPPPQRSTVSTSAVAPPTDDDGFTMVQGSQSRDKRPRGPSKDPILRRRLSKASCLPLLFPLRSEAERVAKVHTLFKSVTNETRPSSSWVYNHLTDYYPHRAKKQLVYFSNVLCLVIAEFHLTCGCTATGMCSPVLPQIVEAELPLLDAYLHKHKVGTQDVHIPSEAAVKCLGVWLHRIDMTVSKQLGKAKADSIYNKDHKLGDLLDFFLMPDNSGVSLDDIFCWAVAENVDALKVRLVKCKKILKQANKTHGKLLTQMAKLKETQEKGLPTKAMHAEATEALHQVADQLE